MPPESRPQVYHVVYDGTTTPRWLVHQEGGTGPLCHTVSRSVAVELALGLGRSARRAQVFIHRPDGSIETAHTFGEVAMQDTEVA